MKKNNLLTVRNLSAFILMLAAIDAISGCQSNNGKINNAYKTNHSNSTPLLLGKLESSLSCSGLSHCEINTISNTPVIDKDTHLPTQQQSKRFLPISLERFLDTHTVVDAGEAYPAYTVKFPNGQHLVSVRYYTDDAFKNVENFNFIYKFKGQSHYQLRAYRQIQKTDYSLLAQSAPTPLCIDLFQDAKLTKRWCKQPNQKGAVTNEFIQMTL